MGKDEYQTRSSVGWVEQGETQKLDNGFCRVSTLLDPTYLGYSFGDVPGAETLTTIGYKLSDFNKVVARADAEGTGRYRHASGEQRQELLGWNQSVGVNLRMEFNLNKARND